MVNIVFISVLVVGIVMVVIQGWLAWKDGYFFPSQLQSRGIFNGWSFLEHGGMWADIFIISPAVAYLLSTQSFYYDWRGWLMFAISILVTSGLGYAYQTDGTTTPTPHAHDGKTTIVGWVHNFYSILFMWPLLMVYVGFTTTKLPLFNFISLSLILTLFFILGVTKFSRRWRFSKKELRQTAGEIISLWIISIYLII